MPVSGRERIGVGIDKIESVEMSGGQRPRQRHVNEERHYHREGKKLKCAETPNYANWQRCHVLTSSGFPRPLQIGLSKKRRLRPVFGCRSFSLVGSLAAIG